MADENFTVPRRAWEQAKSEHQGDGPAIWFSIPEQQVFEAGNHWLRYGGCTEPGSTMTLNGKPMQLNALGAFAGRIELAPGENNITFLARNEDKTTSRSFVVTHNFPPVSDRKALPVSPLRFADSIVVNLPGSYLIEGDEINLNFYASPGAQAWCEIGEVKVPMAETAFFPPKTIRSEEHGGRSYLRKHVAGQYTGSYTVNGKELLDHAAIRFFISGPDEDGSTTTTLSIDSGETLTTDPDRVRKHAEVLDNDTGIYYKPQSFGRITSIDKGLRLETNGQANSEFTRVMLNESDQVGYVLSKYIKESPFSEIEKKQSPPRLAGPVVEKIYREASAKGDLNQLRLKMLWPEDYGTTRLLPNKMECGEDGRSLTWTLWGVRQPSGTGNVVYPLNSIPVTHQIKSATYQYTDAQTLVLKMKLRTERIWGFYVGQDDDDIVLRLKARPLYGQDGKRSLEGLFVLIDAGHGGKDDGALGSAGLTEADINLYMAQRLVKLFQSAGAHTELIRKDDSYIALDDRTASIRASGADLLISIHNNSISTSSDPLKAQGIRMFYYHRHGQELAQSIYDNIVERIDQQPLDLHVRNHAFRLTRVNPHMPGVLVEGAFVSNPDDELRLLNPAFVDRMCEGIYNGVLQWLGLPPTIQAQVMQQDVKQ